MITYTIPIEFNKFERESLKNKLLPSVIMIGAISVMGAIGVIGAIFDVTLITTISFLMLTITIPIGAIIYYKQPHTISQHATNQLNKIVQFEDGTVVPLHQFIVWQESNRHQIVTRIAYDSPVKVIFDNEKIENPQSDADVERNADIDTCRATFGIKSIKDMSDWINQRLSMFETYEKGRRKRVYEKRRMNNNEKQQHAVSKANDLPEPQSVYQLGHDIDKDAKENERQLNALMDKQKEIIEDARERQKGRL